MSRVIYWMQVSLDGIIARPDGDLDWANVDDELHTVANEQARALGANVPLRRRVSPLPACGRGAGA